MEPRVHLARASRDKLISFFIREKVSSGLESIHEIMLVTPGITLSIYYQGEGE